jgi:hypothetical protein
VAKNAQLKSIEALKAAKIALVEFREVANLAASEATNEITRTMSWLANDRLPHWQREIRRRTELLNQARTELLQSQLASDDKRSPKYDAKRRHEKAKFALEEAQSKVRAVKQWIRTLDHEFTVFRGALAPLSHAVAHTVPRGEARLELLMNSVDKYLRLDPERGTPRASKSEDA